MSANVYDHNNNIVLGRKVLHKQNAVKTSTGNSVLHATLRGVYDLATLEAALAATTNHGVGYYSATRLQQMSYNDKINALALSVDPTSLK